MFRPIAQEPVTSSPGCFSHRQSVIDVRAWILGHQEFVMKQISA